MDDQTSNRPDTMIINEGNLLVGANGDYGNVGETSFGHEGQNLKSTLKASGKESMKDASSKGGFTMGDDPGTQRQEPLTSKDEIKNGFERVVLVGKAASLEEFQSLSAAQLPDQQDITGGERPNFDTNNTITLAVRNESNQ